MHFRQNIIKCSNGLTSCDRKKFCREIYFFAQLLNDRVNEYRKENGLKPLLNDEVLFVAAQDHAEFLLKEGKLKSNLKFLYR